MDRFPDDFKFQLTQTEANNLINIGVCQFGTPQYNFSAYLPYAFTEQGKRRLIGFINHENETIL